MIHPVMLLYVAVLFFVLTPGVLLSLPPRGSKMAVAATHAVVFAVLYHLTHKAAWRLAMQLEGFQNAPPAMPNMPNMPKKEGFQKVMKA
jgi:hypothetical protein